MRAWPADRRRPQGTLLDPGRTCAKAGVGLNSVVNVERGAHTVQIGTWFLILWAMDLLDAVEGVARLEDDPEGLALLKKRLPRRVRGGA
jgi:hypothetical protein